MIRWGGAVLATLLFHALLGFGLVLALQPQPVSKRERLETRATLETYDVRSSVAEAETATGDNLDPSKTESDRLAGHSIQTSNLGPVAAPGTTISSISPEVEAIVDKETASASVVSAAFPDVPELTSQALVTPVIAPKPTTATTVVADDLSNSLIVSSPALPAALALTADQIQNETLALLTFPAMPLATLQDQSVSGAAELATVDLNTTTVTAASPTATKAKKAQQTPTVLATVQPAVDVADRIVATTGPLTTLAKVAELTTTPLATVQPTIPGYSASRLPEQPARAIAETGATPADLANLEATVVATAKLPSTNQLALDAVMLGDKIVTDPKALATVAAFLDPGLPAATKRRDALRNLLATQSCARVQVAYVPDVSGLEVRGHVPDLSARSALLAELSSELGDAFPLSDQIKVLPNPQCAALGLIETLGLPQSTDQFTDARVIGPDAQARIYTYTAGQRLLFDVQAPDYNAVIYVDYFDADGQVIHLVPNSFDPLKRHDPKAVTEIGGGELDITIGPPFGQEIAVALAVSDPLYEGERPIREPAEAYLSFLRDRIAVARAENPHFKGEWVYFFIRTKSGLIRAECVKRRLVSQNLRLKSPVAPNRQSFGKPRSSISIDRCGVVTSLCQTTLDGANRVARPLTRPVREFVEH